MMDRKTVVVVLNNKDPFNKDNRIEVWGSFKRMCEVRELPYHTLKILKMPIIYKDLYIARIVWFQRKGDFDRAESLLREELEAKHSKWLVLK